MVPFYSVFCDFVHEATVSLMFLGVSGGSGAQGSYLGATRHWELHWDLVRREGVRACCR